MVMWRGIFVGFVLLTAASTNAQHLKEWLTASGWNDKLIATATQDLKAFTESLREPGNQTERHLSKVFRKAHATFLKKYEAYSDFSSLPVDGRYDCLTATMLFSEVLTRLGYEFSMFETNHHIFMEVNTSDGLVLLESTDKVNGLVTDAAEIAKRKESYRTIVPTATDGSQVSYRFQCQLFQQVSPAHLTGLLYFNQAVKAYNRGDWLASARHLGEGYQAYPSQRCLELGDILVTTLAARKEISHEMRRASMEYLMPLILSRSGKVATNGTD